MLTVVYFTIKKGKAEENEAQAKELFSAVTELRKMLKEAADGSTFLSLFVI
jgi:hypothetical protein